MKTIIVLGKGGVGKTTAAVSLAEVLSVSTAKKVCLVSLDPAHNLADLLGRKISSSGTRLHKNFCVREIDIQKELKKRLRSTARSMRENYRYLATVDLEKNFDLILHSPGSEEYALVEAMGEEFAKGKYEYLIFDMPPTGMSLRMLRLPKQMTGWVELLKKMRVKNQKEKKQLKHLRGETPDENDKLLNQLEKLEKKFHEQDSFLLSSLFAVVYGESNLSLKEAERIFKDLDENKFSDRIAVLNSFSETRKRKKTIKNYFQRERTVEVVFNKQKSRLDVSQLTSLLIKND